MTRKRHGAEPLRITGEIDRVFLGTTARCVVDDRALEAPAVVDKTGSASTVVWNPWSSEGARGMPISARRLAPHGLRGDGQRRPTTR